MQRRIEAHSRAALLIERVVWNAAAAAVLAVMLLVLLGTLRWLDQVSPASINAAGDRPAVSAGIGDDANNTAETAEATDVNRPSG